jgi:hypothetical protein
MSEKDNPSGTPFVDKALSAQKTLNQGDGRRAFWEAINYPNGRPAVRPDPLRKLSEVEPTKSGPQFADKA